MQLECIFSPREPACSQTHLDLLQECLRDLLPLWSTGLSASEMEWHEKTHVGASRLSEVVGRWVPGHGVSHAVLTGEYNGVAFYLTSTSTTWPPVLNSVAIEIVDRESVESQPAQVWMRSAFKAFSDRVSMRYAHACCAREFAAKNLVEGPGSLRAIGVDFTKGLPGLYWLNYFGREYVEFIGRERLLAAPAFDVQPVGEGILLALDQSPLTWDTARYRSREAAVIDHLGRQFFFSRHDPERATIAPNIDPAEHSDPAN